MDRPLDENDEETQERNDAKSRNTLNRDKNGLNTLRVAEKKFMSKAVMTATTQTENFWPYEHLFLGVFPSLESGEIKPSPEASPAPFNIPDEKSLPTSIYDTLDQ